MLTSIGQIITLILGGLILQFLPTQTLPTISIIIFILIFILWRWTFANSVQEEEEQLIKSKIQVINL